MMVTKEIKYICPKCKNTYQGLTPIEYCICGTKLVSQDGLEALRDVFSGFDFPSTFNDMFKRKK